MEQNFQYKKRILFIGVPDMAYVVLNACCQVGINIVGVMGPKPTHNMYSHFKKFVEARGLNFICYEDLKSPELLKQIKELNVDLAVVASFNYKIPKELLEIVKDGFLNIHPSLLPLYRGANPYTRVIMNAEKETGVTLHFMSEEFDEGDIVLQSKCDIDVDETMGSLFNKTNQIGLELIMATLREYEQYELPRIPQRQGDFITAPNVTSKETMIDYNKSANDIERLIRALNPFILANTFFRNEYVKVMSAKIVDKKYSSNIENGTIVEINDDGAVVKTSKGGIVFTIMQYGSHFVGDEKKFIKYVKPEVGERFY